MQAEVEKLIKQVAAALERIQFEYNRYFTGAEKKPPTQLREKTEKDVEKLKAMLRQVQGAAATQFSAQSTIQRYQSYRTLWDKKLAEREKTR